MQHCAQWLNCTVCPPLQLLHVIYWIARNVAGLEVSSTSATFHTIALCVCLVTKSFASQIPFKSLLGSHAIYVACNALYLRQSHTILCRVSLPKGFFVAIFLHAYKINNKTYLYQIISRPKE